MRHDARLPLLLNWVYDNDRTFEFLHFKNGSSSTYTALLMDCYEG